MNKKTFHFSETINAPVEKVWDLMLQNPTYREWTEAFGKSGDFEGSWDEGADIRFLAPEDDGSMSGMFSKIRENRRYEFVSIEHLGVVQHGKNDTSTPWTGAYENYTFKRVPEGTQLEISLDIPAEDIEMQKMMSDMWPKALKKLKEMAERK